MNGLVGKVVVVAGGAGGIGSATSLRLAQEGAAVVVGDLDAAAAQAVASQIVERGGRALAVGFDISDDASVAALIQAAVREFGALDALHANAADLTPQTIGSDTDALTVELGVFDRTMTVNMRGHLLCTRHALPELLARGGGALVFTSSAAAFIGEPERPSYAIAKSGINAARTPCRLTMGQGRDPGERSRSRTRPHRCRPELPRPHLPGLCAQRHTKRSARHARRHRRHGRLPLLIRRRMDQRPDRQRRRRSDPPVDAGHILRDSEWGCTTATCRRDQGVRDRRASCSTRVRPHQLRGAYGADGPSGASLFLGWRPAIHRRTQRARPATGIPKQDN